MSLHTLSLITSVGAAEHQPTNDQVTTSIAPPAGTSHTEPSVSSSGFIQRAFYDRTSLTVRHSGSPNDDLIQNPIGHGTLARRRESSTENVSPVEPRNRDRMSINITTEIRTHIAEAADTTLHALDKLRFHREPIIPKTQTSKHPVLSLLQQGKTGTSLTQKDVYRTKLNRKLGRAIRNERSVNNKTGFLPQTQLFRLINIESVARELRKRDIMLEGNPLLCRLRFTFPEGDQPSNQHERRGGFDNIAQIICGPGQRQHPISSPKDESVTEDNDSLSLDNQKTYSKVLAILILLDRPARIKPFIDAGVCDQDLPLIRSSADDPLETSTLRKADNTIVPLECFDGWSDNSTAEFEELQWKLLAPRFAEAQRKHVPHYDFHPKTILPFRFFRKESIRPGGFGQVRKVEIHSSHRDFSNPDTSNSFFAIKTLHGSRCGSNFRREVEALRRLSGDFHPHLISLLGTYQKDNIYHLIFPWAETDLMGYWERFKPGNKSSEREDALFWLARQSQGITEGLREIHRYSTVSFKSLLQASFPGEEEAIIAEASKSDKEEQAPRHLFGRHGDIKPENILWFPYSDNKDDKGRGILKITDFGFAEFSSRESVDSRRRGFIAFSPTYRAPELELDNRLVSWSYDIWTLGCVYLLFTTWWLGGWSLVKKFSQCRLKADQVSSPEWQGQRYAADTFFVITKDSDKGKRALVKPSVTKFIEKLLKHEQKNDFTDDFLHLIQKSMLIVEDENIEGKRIRRMGTKAVGDNILRLRCERWPETTSVTSRASTMTPDSANGAVANAA